MNTDGQPKTSVKEKEISYIKKNPEVEEKVVPDFKTNNDGMSPMKIQDPSEWPIESESPEWKMKPERVKDDRVSIHDEPESDHPAPSTTD